MGLVTMVAGLVLFLGAHGLIANRSLRASTIEKMGEIGWKGLISVASLIGLVLVVQGFGAYRAGGLIPVWTPPRFFSHITALLMLPAMIALVAAYVPSRIKVALKHPMLLAVKIWALAHLLTNGDLGGIILFGSFLAWAVADRIALKRRAATEPPKPVATGSIANDIVVVLVGTLVYLAVVFWVHPLWIGVPVFGG
jgi:uncharacterized membrane protein